MSDLRKISDAMAEITSVKEQERRAHNKFLAEHCNLLLFKPFPDAPEGHGTGWFQVGENVIAFRKYSNGYSEHPMIVLPVGELRLLLAAWKD